MRSGNLASAKPLVSCIMPTADRRPFVPLAIEYFLSQDYANRELVIVDDGSDRIGDLVPDHPAIRYLKLEEKISTGAKRNYACEQANGDIIMHWDDDDWMSPWRISYQVEKLTDSSADICGLDSLLFWDPVRRKSWEYTYHQSNRPWIAGGTLCYAKSLWARNRFAEISEGEDTRYVFNMGSRKILALEDKGFYVALVHAGNTSKKRTDGSHWHAFPIDQLQAIVTDKLGHYERIFSCGPVAQPANKAHPLALPGEGDPKPLVSGILPTYNRPGFIRQAVKYFLRQNYPHKQLVIVDDSSVPVENLIPCSPEIKYIRLPRRTSVGEKRNLACDAANGEIIISWDDDDWYSPDRIACQVQPLLDGSADLTGMGNSFFLYLKQRQFWTISERLHERMFAHGIISGTMCFRKRLWAEGTRFEHVSMADDAKFINDLKRKGARLKKVEQDGVFVYVRHETNTWKFSTGSYLNKRDWQTVSAPEFIPAEDLEFYTIGERAKSSRKPVTQKPLASCIMATYGRHQFLIQAIKYFLAQSYENKELIIIDDGDEAIDLATNDKSITYIKLEQNTPLGEKLNIGIREARGNVIQKLDDDDYYHPDFLATTVAALTAQGTTNAIVACDSFLVLVLKTGELKLSGQGWCAGGTLCFYRELWERKPFRNERRAVDWWFLKDHSPKRIKLSNPELYILVRHDSNHLWQNMNGTSVTSYFEQRQNFDKPLNKLLPPPDYEFYRKLGETCPPASYTDEPVEGGKTMELKITRAPDKNGRDAMYYADKQDYAYQQGAYDYLQSIAMLPRMATIAGYLKKLGLTRVLDIGCGTGELLHYLDSKIKYTGIDISDTAIETAKQNHAQRKNATFVVDNFRDWHCQRRDHDAFLWAGIGCTWTLKGRGGSSNDWLDILDKAEQVIKPDGVIIMELVTQHWGSLERLIEGRYIYEAGCDLVCFQCAESPNRSIRVFRKRPAS